jgi:hypothetical protein
MARPYSSKDSRPRGGAKAEIELPEILQLEWSIEMPLYGSDDPDVDEKNVAIRFRRSALI